MAAWVEATTRELSKSTPHINQSKPSVSASTLSGDTGKPALGPKPHLMPKPFALQRNATVRPIKAPRIEVSKLSRAASSDALDFRKSDSGETNIDESIKPNANGTLNAAPKPTPLTPKPALTPKPKSVPEPNTRTSSNSRLDVSAGSAEDVKDVQPRSRAKSLGSQDQKPLRQKPADAKVSSACWPARNRLSVGLTSMFESSSKPEREVSSVRRDAETSRTDKAPLSPLEARFSKPQVETEEVEDGEISGSSIKRRISLLFDRSSASHTRDAVNKKDTASPEISVDIKQRIKNLSLTTHEPRVRLSSAGALKCQPHEKTSSDSDEPSFSEESLEKPAQSTPVQNGPPKHSSPPNAVPETNVLLENKKTSLRSTGEPGANVEEVEEDKENHIAVPVYRRVGITKDLERQRQEEEEKQQREEQLEKERKEQEREKHLEKERKRAEEERRLKEERKLKEEKQKQLEEQKREEEERTKRIEEERKLEEERKKEAEKERQREQERLEREKQIEEQKRRIEEKREQERQREELRLRQEREKEEKLKKEREMEEKRQIEEERLRQQRNKEERLKKEREMEENKRIEEEKRLRQEREKEERLKKEREMEEKRRIEEEERLRQEREKEERLKKEREMEEKRQIEEQQLRLEREREERLKKEREMEEKRLIEEEKRLRQEREKEERLRKEREMEEKRRIEEEKRLRQEREKEERLRKEREMEEKRLIEEEKRLRQEREERLRKEREMEEKRLIEEEKRLRQEREERLRKEREMEEKRRIEEEKRLRQEREKEERLRKEREMEEKRLIEEEKRLRQEREERLRKEREMEEKRLIEEEKRLRQEREERLRKEREMEEKRLIEEEKRLRQEREERLRKEREMEEKRLIEEEKRLRQEREERLRKEREMEEKRRIEEQRMRQEREREERLNIERELEKKRRIEEEERWRQERENERLQMRYGREEVPTSYDLISFDTEEPKSSRGVESIARTKTVSPQRDEVIYDDFSVKPRRWGTQERRSSTPSPSRESPTVNETPDWLQYKSNDPGFQELSGDQNSEISKQPQIVEESEPEDLLGSEHDEVTSHETELKDCDEDEDEEQDPFDGNREIDETNNTDDDPGAENRVNQVLQRLTSQVTRRSIDSDTPDVFEPEPILFPQPAAPLLDSSLLRSKVDLGKKRSIKRMRPSRAVRQRAALPSLTEGTNLDWRFCDSTDAKAPCSNGQDSESEEETSKDATPTPSRPKRVPLFPGVDQSALMAQLKRRSVRMEAEATDDQTSPVVSARSPRTPTRSLGPRVLPPVDSKDGGGASPSWLLELKSKKRLSQP
nr:182 kDa tankyrase-1-binding protein [Misgurnus anguillicaudatus]